MTEKIDLDNDRSISCDDHSHLASPFKYKSEISADLKEKLREIPGALEYIQKLEKLIEKHLKKILKLKNKLKKTGRLEDASTQTDFDAATLACTTDIAAELPISEPKSLADDIKDAAELAMKNTGFVYEETSGMYYDYNTGYYYNAEYGLYYDGSTGTYLKYNQETQSYEFHSQVSVPETPQPVEQQPATRKGKRKNKNASRNKDVKRQRGKESAGSPTKDFEEGECSDSGGSTSEDGADSDSSDLSKQYPPCMRVIVESAGPAAGSSQSSTTPRLEAGSLHVITCAGGTVGRAAPGASHSIVVPDAGASKHHLRIAFDGEKGRYYAVDLGSRNGTLLNGERMSAAKRESEPLEVVHGSRLQIGATVLLCHVHDGNGTCAKCEPGLLAANSRLTEAIEKVPRISRSERHKNELKTLKMKCGVGVEYEEDPKLAAGYTDRAQKRRETVGSQNPHEKTKMASVDESIGKENKGFKLLAKMGWKEGQSLGKDGEGLLEPVKAVANKGTAGIGARDAADIVVATEKQTIWKKTQERFDKLPDTTDAFED